MHSLSPDIDFHTHDLTVPAGSAIVNVPKAWLVRPEAFAPVPGGLYSAGIHPWWTAEDEWDEALFAGLEILLSHPQVVALGECGLDRLRGGSMERQCAVFGRQVWLAGRFGLPVTVHCVRAFDVLLHMHKSLRPATRWTVHGFRGRPALARQLLAAGIDLSFGSRYDAGSFALVPPGRRHVETDGPETPLSDRLKE